MNQIIEGVKFWRNEFEAYQTFYLIIIGFVLFQLVADFCGNLAANICKSLPVFTRLSALGFEIIIRAFFLLVQSCLLFAIEEGMSPFKLRILLCVWLNCAIKACSVEANPFETCIVLWIAISPVFQLYDNSLKESAEQRQKAEMVTELPMSMPRGDIKIANSYTPSLFVTLKSIVFMTYLLSRRVQLTPDFFHFVTCLKPELQHMLWPWLLWIY